MSAVRIACIGLFCCATSAYAQSWPELDTLVFSPHRPVAELPLAEAAAGFESAPAETERVLLERVEQLGASLAARQLEHGENSPALVDDLLALAAVHRQLGEHSAALSVLDRAQHIIRVESGLYSLEQVVAVEAMIENLAAADDYLRTPPLEAYLHELVQRHPDDPRVVDVLTALADRQLAAAHHYLVNGIAPSVDVSIGGDIDAIPSQGSPTARQLARHSLRAARRSYVAALDTAVRTGVFRVSDLLALEDRVVDTLYFEILHPELVGGRFVRSTSTPLAANALDVLGAKLENSRSFPGTPAAVAGALIEIADWRLMFGSHAAALDVYREARRVLVAGDVAAAAIDAMLSPEEPVFLPDFPARFSGAGAARHVPGWFDIDVEISRYGRIKDLEIVGRSDSATDAVEGRFRRHLAMHRFRPRFAGDDLAESDAFSMRYHFSYERLPD